MRILGLLDQLVPSVIRNDSHEQLVRARVLVAALLLGCVVTILAELPSLLQSDSAQQHQLAGLFVTGLTVAFYLCCLMILRRTASLVLAGNLYGVGIYLGITAGVSVTGGFEKSPFLQILLIVPLFMFLICGRSWGYVWTFMIIATFAVFFALPILGVEIPDIGSTPHQNIVVFTLWVVLCVSLMTCLTIYDSLNKDLAQRIRIERDKFKHEAAHDALTELANRRTHLVMLTQGIEDCRKSGSRLALLAIDLNGFKPINDRHGHHAGDFVLQVVGERLKNAVRSSDMVARLGGDEFSVILHTIKDSAVAVQVARKIQDTISIPIKFDEQLLSISASIGIAIYPEDGQDPDALTKFADNAMYTAKQSKFKIQR